MVVERTGFNAPRFPKRIDPEISYAYDQGNLLQIDGTHEVINRWSISDAPREVVIDAIAALSFDDDIPDHLLTHSDRLRFLVDLFAFGTAQLFPKTRRPTNRIVRQTSERAQALLIDALSNTMDLHSEHDFVEWVASETELTAAALRLIHRQYWNLEPLEREGLEDVEWAQWIHETLFSPKSGLV